MLLAACESTLSLPHELDQISHQIQINNPFFALSRDYSCDATVASDFQRTKAESFRFLISLYDKACGSEHEWFSAWEISKKLGLGEQEVRPLVDRLIKEGLISLRAFDGLIGISHKGVVEIERVRSCAGSDDRHIE